jgi:hypothetical protein
LFFYNEQSTDFNSNIHKYFYHLTETASLVRVFPWPYLGEVQLSPFDLCMLVPNRSRGYKTKIDGSFLSLWWRAAHFKKALQRIEEGEAVSFQQLAGQKRFQKSISPTWKNDLWSVH